MNTQKVDFYPAIGNLPNGQAPARRPTLVYVHGGGWGSDSCTAGTACPDPLARKNPPQLILRYVTRGWHVASVEYRALPSFRHPDPVHDVKAAIRWLKTQPGVDPARIVLSGISAGGQIAALAAMSASQNALEPQGLPANLTVPGLNSKVKALFVWQGPEFSVYKKLQGLWSNPNKCPGLAGMLNPVDCNVNLHLNCLLKPSGAAPFHADCTPALVSEVSAVTYVNSTSPMTYLAYSPADFAVPPDSGEALAKKLRQMNVPKNRVYFDLVDRMQDTGATPPSGMTNNGGPGHTTQLVGLNLDRFDEFMNLVLL
jgi:acetyl esterase/lipase